MIRSPRKAAIVTFVVVTVIVVAGLIFQRIVSFYEAQREESIHVLRNHDFTVQEEKLARAVPLGLHRLQFDSYSPQYRISRSAFFGAIPYERVHQHTLLLAKHIVSYKCISVDVNNTYLQSVLEMPQLRDVGFSGLSLNDHDFATISGTVLLESFELNAPDVGDSGLLWLRKCPNLVSVRVSGTRVSDTFVEALTNCSNLQILDISGTDVSVESLQHLSKIDSLVRIDMRSTRNMSDNNWSSPAGMHELKSFNGDNTKCGDALAGWLSACPEIQSISLRCTQVSDSGLRDILEKCHKLEFLSVAGCSVSGIAFKAEPFPRSLHTIDVSDTLVELDDLREITQKHMQIIHIRAGHLRQDSTGVSSAELPTDMRPHREDANKE